MFFFFQSEDGIRDLVRFRGLGDVYKRQGLYPVQLWHEGKPLAEAEVRLDRQRLLEREYQFSAHDYGMELFDAVFTGALGRASQRLAGQAGAEGEVGAGSFNQLKPPTSELE